LPLASPDLFNGTAGRLRFQLLLYDQTGDEEYLRHALAAGEMLLAQAEEVAPDECCWPIPAGYGGLSGHAYLGYAHGAAGIADALLDLADVTGEACFLATAEAAARWLVRLAVPAGEQGQGLAWPTVAGGAPTTPFWCHGAAGIGGFLLRLAARVHRPDLLALAQRAAYSAARGARWAGPVQCHGLAGNIEFLLDCYQTTGEHMYLVEARTLAQLLIAWASEAEGALRWPAEAPHVFTPDYLVGYAGVAVCLLRLSDPEPRPSLLSRAGFRYRPAMPAGCGRP
jgi:lantibiotic modifying enzyme